VDGGGERASGGQSGGRLIDRQRAQNMPLPHRCGRPPCKAQSARNRVRLAGWLAASSEGATVRANRLAVGQRGRSGRPAERALGSTFLAANHFVINMSCCLRPAARILSSSSQPPVWRRLAQAGRKLARYYANNKRIWPGHQPTVSMSFGPRVWRRTRAGRPG